MKVKVNQDLCEGHSRCAAIAPGLFELDDMGHAQEVGDGTVPEGMEAKARLAKANCPEYAVEILGDD